MPAARHTSFMALALTVLLLVGQATLANHVFADALHGINDNCELCHQFDRQQLVIPASADTPLLDPAHAPLHDRNAAPLQDTLPSAANARGPPLS